MSLLETKFFISKKEVACHMLNIIKHHNITTSSLNQSPGFKIKPNMLASKDKAQCINYMQVHKTICHCTSLQSKVLLSKI